MVSWTVLPVMEAAEISGVADAAKAKEHAPEAPLHPEDVSVPSKA